MTLTEKLKAQALAEGFSAVGVTRPDAVPELADRLAAFVEAGRHGDMGFPYTTLFRSTGAARPMRCGPRQGRSSCWPSFIRRSTTRWP